jgi:hypothetical protein
LGVGRPLVLGSRPKGFCLPPVDVIRIMKKGDVLAEARKKTKGPTNDSQLNWEKKNPTELKKDCPPLVAKVVVVASSGFSLSQCPRILRRSYLPRINKLNFKYS